MPVAVGFLCAAVAAPSTSSTPRLSESPKSSVPSISTTEPRQNAPHPGIAASALSTPRTCSSAPLLRHQGPRRPGPRRPAPDNPGTVVTAFPTPLASAPFGATCQVSSPGAFAPLLPALEVLIQPRARLALIPPSLLRPPPPSPAHPWRVGTRARTPPAYPAPITLANIPCLTLPQNA